MNHTSLYDQKTEGDQGDEYQTKYVQRKTERRTGRDEHVPGRGVEILVLVEFVFENFLSVVGAYCTKSVQSSVEMSEDR